MLAITTLTPIKFKELLYMSLYLSWLALKSSKSFCVFRGTRGVSGPGSSIC